MAKSFFVVSLFFAVLLRVADGKELLCRQLADGKELADGKLADSSSVSYVVPAYSASQILCFVLFCGIRVASKSNVESIPFLNGVLILLCEY